MRGRVAGQARHARARQGAAVPPVRAAAPSRDRGGPAEGRRPLVVASRGAGAAAAEDLAGIGRGLSRRRRRGCARQRRRLSDRRAGRPADRGDERRRLLRAGPAAPASARRASAREGAAVILTGHARLAGVMGWPVAHSLSPRLHGYWLREYGIDGAYVPLAVKPERLASALRALPDLGFAGCNLTVPHKQAALATLDEVAPEARR